MSLPTVGAGPSAAGWTPARVTPEGSELPVLWLWASIGTWQDSVGGTPADEDAEVLGAWDDQSASNYDATQGTADNKPILKLNILNGKPVIRFDGTNDKLALPDAFYTNYIGGDDTPLSAFVVVNYSSGVIMENVGNPPQSIYRPLDGFRRDSANVSKSFTAVSTGAWKIYSSIFNGTNISTYENGSVVDNNADLDVGALTVAGVTVSRIGDTYTEAAPLDGDLAELIIYDAALSSADRQQVENYLSNQYGIALS